MTGNSSIRFYRGRSMEGTFRPGDSLTVQPGTLSDLRVGDVVVFRDTSPDGSDEDLVHRLVASTAGGFVAQGDSNPCADSTLVTEENLVGRVYHAERAGKTRRVVGGRVGLWRARILRVGRCLWRVSRRATERPWEWIRRSGIARRLWSPPLRRIRVRTDRGYVVKYTHRGRTVARWWPATGQVSCRRFYSLVIRPEAHVDTSSGGTLKGSELSPPPSDWLHTDLP